MSKIVEIVVVGAGSRGAGYSEFIKQHPKTRIVGVAEPRDHYRDTMAREYEIPPENVFTDWRQMIAKGKIADAVIIATTDALHTEPAVAFANAGYNMLLEKPMAPDEESCRKIVAAVTKNDILFCICHVMRYTNYTRKVKEIVDSGAIGTIVSIQHLEPIGYWHFAHSYVRGNWRNESQSSSMLLAKSCHDLDWLRYIVGVPCKKVSSFGGLYHFKPERRPAGAADRCTDCPIEAKCPYSAKKIYLDRVSEGHIGWPVNVLTPDVTPQSVTKAIQDGPYGRCVWACDNDVADHQVVNLEFEDSSTASFTVTAFNEGGGRQTQIYGTAGELRGVGSQIEIYDYLTKQTEVIQTDTADATILGGHGGGDYHLMQSFVDALVSGDRGKILSGPRESLETHLMVFAAEKARKQNIVVEIK